MRIKKWWWSLFAYTVDLMIQNAWMLYCKTPSYQEKPLDLLSLRRDFVRAYLIQHAYASRVCRPGRPQPLSHQVPTKIRHDKHNHFFADSETQRCCAQCGKNTRKECKKCDIGLHLHCFSEFHGNLD